MIIFGPDFSQEIRVPGVSCSQKYLEVESLFLEICGSLGRRKFVKNFSSVNLPFHQLGCSSTKMRKTEHYNFQSTVLAELWKCPVFSYFTRNKKQVLFWMNQDIYASMCFQYFRKIPFFAFLLETPFSSCHFESLWKPLPHTMKIYCFQYCYHSKYMCVITIHLLMQS